MPLSRTRELLRRRQPPPPATSTPSREASQALSHVQRDHDYGEPGPSTLRNTRRMLSRHQRNPDELDNSSSVVVDPLRIPTDNAYVSGRLRHRNNRPASSFTINTSVPEQDPDEESDPEDNKPLHLMVTESPQRNRHSMRNIQDNSTSSSLSTSRGSRTLKRPYYNEDSDESIRSSSTHNRVNGRTGQTSNGHPSKRRMVIQEDDEDDDDHSYTPNRRSATTATTAAAAATNGRSTRTRHNYDEMTNSDDGDSEEEHQISVSSRGRIRRISSKVRGYFRDN